MTFGEKVLKVRGQLQLTQTQLAEKLGVSYPTVNRWEMGHNLPAKLVQHRFDDFCKQNGITFDDAEGNK